jgi:hypothetical protein
LYILLEKHVKVNELNLSSLRNLSHCLVSSNYKSEHLMQGLLDATLNRLEDGKIRSTLTIDDMFHTVNSLLHMCFYFNFSHEPILNYAIELMDKYEQARSFNMAMYVSSVLKNICLFHPQETDMMKTLLTFIFRNFTQRGIRVSEFHLFHKVITLNKAAF